MSSGSGGPRAGRGERPSGQGARRGGAGTTGGGAARPPRAPQGAGRGGNRQEAARRAAQEAARRRTIIGIVVGVVALIAAIVVVVLALNNNSGSSAAAPTATAAVGTPPVTISTVPPPPPAASIPSAPLVSSLPTAAEVSASKAACAPFLAAGQSKQGAKKWGVQPKQVIDPSKRYQITMYTEKGTISADILPTIAPITANSFIFLSCNGFYDGLTFHRIVKGFVIQGGDPKGDGSGGPGYQFADEPVRRGYAAGDFAMANSGANTNGSQFFIIQGASGAALPPSYNLFGHVTRGENVVDAIVSAPAHSSPGSPDASPSTPNSPVHIRAITVQVS